MATEETQSIPAPVHLYFHELPPQMEDERIRTMFREVFAGYLNVVGFLPLQSRYDWKARFYDGGTMPVEMSGLKGMALIAPGADREFRKRIRKLSVGCVGILHGNALTDPKELERQVSRLCRAWNQRGELKWIDPGTVTERKVEDEKRIKALLSTKTEPPKPKKPPRKEFVEIDGVMRTKIDGVLQPLPPRETPPPPAEFDTLTDAVHDYEESMAMPVLIDNDNITRALIVGGTEPTARSLAAWLLKDRNIEVTDFWPLERPPKVQTADVPSGVTLVIVLEDALSAQHSNAVTQAIRGHGDVKVLRTSRRKAVLSQALDVGGFRSVKAPAYRPIRALLAGGPEDRYRELKEDLMAKKEIDLQWHWEWDRKVTPLPKDCELVIILIDMAGHNLIEMAVAAAKRGGIPFVRTGQKWSQMEPHLDRELMKVKRVPIVDDESGEVEVDDAALLDFMNDFNEEKSTTAVPAPIEKETNGNGDAFANKNEAILMLGLKNHHYMTQLVRDGHLEEQQKVGPGSKGYTLQYRLSDLAALELKIRDILPAHAFTPEKHAEWKRQSEGGRDTKTILADLVTKGIAPPAPTPMPAATSQMAALERVKTLLREIQGLLTTALIEEVSITSKGVKVKRLVMQVTEEDL